MASVESADQMAELWVKTYNSQGKPDWSHILPYYADDISFRDSIQEIHGIDEYREMTERLAGRSQEMKMNVVHACMQGNAVFLEWELTIIFKKRPRSVLYGSSRLTLDEHGKIKAQRDYFDLWGDIIDNIPFAAKSYRKFMKKKFG